MKYKLTYFKELMICFTEINPYVKKPLPISHGFSKTEFVYNKELA